MTHASLSAEGQIENGLSRIGCSQRQFTEIACCKGIHVSTALVSLCLSGKREFNQSTAKSLRNLMRELIELHTYFHGVPLNWSAPEGVSTLLVKRKLEQAIAALDQEAREAKNEAVVS